jgi:diguanylate cyclase (GGDEF)-like protein
MKTITGKNRDEAADGEFFCNVPLHRELEKRLPSLEFRHPVTGLFNRRSFDIVLDMELEKARRSREGRIRAILILDIAGLGEVNARHGVDVGDLLLETCAIRVSESLRAGDFVFHFEGATFAGILTTLQHELDIPLVAERIRDSVCRPYHREGIEIRLDARIGVAFSPSDSDDAKVLVRSAFSALADATKSGRPLGLYDHELYLRAMERTRIKTDIRKAIVEEQFRLHFQPVVDAERRIVGAEALIRWNHPSLGLVSPGSFIPVAEESRDIKTIGRWVFYQACALMRDWSTRYPGLYLSINLTPSEFDDDELLALLCEAAGRHDTMAPGSIKLEITETQGMRDIAATIARIERLRSLGLEVMIDDFGSGYSSLAWLKRLPASVIKVDKAFCDTIVEDEDDRDFLKGMIEMIASRGKKVLVEGVDSARKFEILRELGCDLMQGYWLARPLPEHDFERLLAAGGPLPSA